MPNISMITTAIAITSIKDEIIKYENFINESNLDDPFEYELLILSYEKALWELEEAYKKEWQEGSNLTSYEELTKDLYQRYNK